MVLTKQNLKFKERTEMSTVNYFTIKLYTKK